MGLETSVFGKGGAGFLRLGQAEFAGRNQIEAKRLEQFLEFLELALVMGRQDQAIAVTQLEQSAHLALLGLASSARTTSCQIAQASGEGTRGSSARGAAGWLAATFLRSQAI